MLYYFNELLEIGKLTLLNQIQVLNYINTLGTLLLIVDKIS